MEQAGSEAQSWGFAFQNTEEVAPDTADHFLPREAEDISQLKSHSVKGEGKGGKKESVTLPAFRLNTLMHCKLNSGLRGNLLTDTVLMVSRERYFLPLPEDANSQNSLKLPLSTQKHKKDF